MINMNAIPPEVQKEIQNYMVEFNKNIPPDVDQNPQMKQQYEAFLSGEIKKILDKHGINENVASAPAAQAEMFTQQPATSQPSMTGQPQVADPMQMPGKDTVATIMELAGQMRQKQESTPFEFGNSSGKKHSPQASAVAADPGGFSLFPVSTPAPQSNVASAVTATCPCGAGALAMLTPPTSVKTWSDPACSYKQYVIKCTKCGKSCLVTEQWTK